jgi:alpha-tubulin suppressor-like RCC1 family protein
MLHRPSSFAAAAALVLALTGCEGIFDSDSPREPEFASVAAGRDANHSCALTTGGEAYCWGGENFLGELGTGSVDRTMTPQTTARRVTGGIRFRTISAASVYTCGTTAEAAVYCWGLNQAFNATGPVNEGTPTPTLLAGARWSEVQTDMVGPCGIVPEGSATCGARSGSGYGFATIASGQRFESFTRFASFVPAPELGRNASRLYQHQCAISDGAVYCWGDNSAGELGNGTLASATAPTRIASPLQFTRVATGARHSCALAADGTVWCWGEGTHGRLGNGGVAGSATPVQVAGGLRFTALSAGFFHSCAVATDGAAYCWGLNGEGQLGSASTARAADGNAYTASPALVSGGLRWKQVSAGDGHSCGVTSDAKLRCWGENLSGQLGDGTTTSSMTPVPVRVES